MAGVRQRLWLPGAVSLVLTVGFINTRADRAPSEEFQTQLAVRRLHHTESSVRGLSAAVADMEQRLSGAERSFTKAMSEAAEVQGSLVELTSNIANAKENDLSELAAKEAAAKAAEHKLGFDLGSAEREEDKLTKGVAIIAHTAKQWRNSGQIENLQASLCLDAGETPESNGGRARSWACLQGERNQLWEYNGILIKNRRGLCLASPPTPPHPTDGTVVMWSCDASLQSQRWHYNESIGRFANAFGQCLSCPEARGENVRTADCEENLERQTWDMSFGSPRVSRRLQTLNKQLWSAMSARSSDSIRHTERRVSALVAEVSQVRTHLEGRARGTLASQLRHGADGKLHRGMLGLKTALDRLRDTQLESATADE
jgi:hypothetical protein